MLKKRLINLLIIVLALILISSLSRQVWQLYKAGKNLEHASVKLEGLKSENIILEKELARVQSPEFIEKEARNKLSLVRDGEVVVVLPSQSNESGNSQDKQKKQLANWQKWFKILF